MESVVTYSFGDDLGGSRIGSIAGHAVSGRRPLWSRHERHRLRQQPRFSRDRQRRDSSLWQSTR